jgi:hypothetical protein
MSNFKTIVSILLPIFATIGGFIFLNFIKPLTKYNQNKWEKIKEVITENDFEMMSFEIYNHYIDESLNSKLYHLISLIKSETRCYVLKLLFQENTRRSLIKLRICFIN